MRPTSTMPAAATTRWCARRGPVATPSSWTTTTTASSSKAPIAAAAARTRARAHARKSGDGTRGDEGASVNDGGGGGDGDASQAWMKPLEGLMRQAARVVTVYQAPAPPPAAPGAKMDALEAVLRWHLGSDTSTTLVLKEVTDVIISEVTSFPASKLVVGETPSVAMHVSVPSLRATTSFPATVRELVGGRSVENPGSEGNVMPVDLPVWTRWSQPTTALTLRTVLMVTSALAAAAGMQRSVADIVDDPKNRIYVLVPDGALGDLQRLFNRFWPNAPYVFASYSRNGLSDEDADNVCETRRKGHRKLVILVNISAPGDEDAAESDGEAMVNTVELLLEKEVPFVQLTLWLDNSLANSVVSRKPRNTEKDRIKVLMENRTRILLGRSVKRVQARKRVLLAFEAAQANPQGRALIDLEERLAEARALGAMSDDGEKMMRDIRGKASAAEELALANALRAACIQVPMDVPALKSTYARAEQYLKQQEIVEDVADVRASMDDMDSTDETAASTSYDPDPFAAVVESLSGDGENKKNARSALMSAVISAERGLQAAELEANLRTALADDSSRTVESVPRLEELLVRAAKLAVNGPPLTQEGAAKLNTLVSRVQSRATALQDMESARAALIEAMSPSTTGIDQAVGGITAEDVKMLEAAVARARSSAWPWQLDEPIEKAERLLVRWRRLDRLETAILSRSKTELRLALAEAQQDPDSLDLDTRRAKKVLSELDAESALEGGDQRLRAYFAASKVAWSSGSVTPESAQMLLTLRESLDITQAEHEQIQRMANAASGLIKPTEPAKRPEAKRTSKKPVRFAAADAGVRGPMFESDEMEELDLEQGENSDVLDEVQVAWANAIPDEDGVGVATGASDEETSGNWRRVGDSIIYNEEEVIGVGSAGTYVFRGYVKHTSRARHAVAVKRIARPPGEKGRDLVQLVEREVELMTALNQSPLVPFFHCWGITSSNVFIAQELCPESLREHIARQPSLSASKRIKLLRGIAEGISWLHDDSKTQGCITHNDLKPENLLVTSNGQVKIADVGLGVRLRNAEGENNQYSLSTFNKYGVSIILAGRAPEILARRPLTPAADIWAMGVVFFYVLTGLNSPYGDDPSIKPSDDEILQGRYNLQRLMSAHEMTPRRAIEARHLLSSMLSPDPTNRPKAGGVLSHPLLWDDDTALENLSNLHRRAPSLQTNLTSVLQSVSTRALLSGGDNERGALLAAASMDLQDWQRQIDPAILSRVLSHTQRGGEHKNTKSGRGSGEQSTKPYGFGFADLLRFCRNAYEHPPVEREIAPIVQTLIDAAGGESTLLPDGVKSDMPFRRMSRRQRQSLFASYVMHLFPGLSLAVHECALATETPTARVSA